MRGTGVTHLAGWLFADLLLILVLVVLGGQSSPARDIVADPPPTPTATAGPTLAPSPTPTPPAPIPTPTSAAPVGMLPQSLDLPLLADQSVADDLVNGGPARRAAAARRINEAVDQALAKQLTGEQQRGALVFIWGTDGGCRGCKPTSDASSVFAEAAADAVRRGGHPQLPNDAGFYRGYLDLKPASGTLRMELFLYNS
ncbi:hypothetical protein GCM10009639_26450 [Kitasatospora putterlickiae]|uniref:Uncharacterized protein n=1 Tax=Kitasatospora putterlickiae TaxID=221725 RepID=A0ABN1Y157_9ACTN